MQMVNYNSVFSRTQEKYRNSHASSEQRGSGQSEQSGHGNYKHLGFKNGKWCKRGTVISQVQKSKNVESKILNEFNYNVVVSREQLWRYIG